MNIVWITREEVFNGNTGAKIAIRKKIEELAKKEDIAISLFSIVEPCEMEKKIEIKNIKLNYFPRQVKNAGNFLKNLFTHGLIPYTVSNRINLDMIKALREIIDSKKIDVMIFEHMHTAYYQKVLLPLIRNYNIRTVLVCHNIEFEELKSMYKFEKSFAKRVICLITSFLMARYEKQVFLDHTFDRYYFLSRTDMDFALKKMNPGIRSEYLPPGVDIHENCYLSPDKQDIAIGFVGVMSYAPNIQACLFFYNEVFSRLKEKEKYKFFIIGKDPSDAIRKIGKTDKRVIVTGSVDDVAEYYRRLHVIVIPMISGAGVKIKLYEALSFGKFVVSTRKGAQGTDFEHERHLVIADTPENFLDIFNNYRDNEKKYRKIANTGYDFIQSNYRWEELGNILYNSLKDL